jgi:hypothetical protein
MANIYIKEKNKKELEPKKSTIDFILNYSKSIHCVKSKQLNIIVNLN